jgi:hypothetical protein
LFPIGTVEGGDAKDEPPALRKAILGTWEWPDQSPSIRMVFDAGGEVAVSMRVGDAWHHAKTKYKLLDETTLEIAVAAQLFPDRPITQKWTVELTRDRLRLKITRGQTLTLKRKE